MQKSNSSGSAVPKHPKTSKLDLPLPVKPAPGPHLAVLNGLYEVGEVHQGIDEGRGDGDHREDRLDLIVNVNVILPPARQPVRPLISYGGPRVKYTGRHE